MLTVPARGKKTKSGKGGGQGRPSGRGNPPGQTKKGRGSIPASRGSSKNPSSLLPLVTVWLMVLVILAGFIYWARENRQVRAPLPGKVDISPPKTAALPQQPPPKSPAPEKAELPEKPSQPPQTLASRREEAPSPPKETVLPPPMARVAIVIDDLGQDLEMAKKFLRVPLPLTFSILPFQQHSREIADLAHEHGREVLVHLPMEPKDYPKTHPGQGALLVSMSRSAMQKALREALDSIPHASGVNNHMGSRFTESPELMGIVLTDLRQRGLYFLDSYTSGRSVCTTLATQLDLPSLRRHVFLDHQDLKSLVERQIELLIRKARVEGATVAIGHPRKTTLEAIHANVERFHKEEVQVVPARELLPQRAGSS